MAADWAKIEQEYITSDQSYRQLADKYKIPLRTIARHAGDGEWHQRRQQYAKKVASKTLEKSAESAAKDISRTAAKLTEAAEKALQIILGKMADPELLNARDLRSITGALKDIKDVQGIKSDADSREQEARIANLRKQAEAENNDNKVEVVFSSSADDWGQ